MPEGSIEVIFHVVSGEAEKISFPLVPLVAGRIEKTKQSRRNRRAEIMC
jgi:hypothetical protein